MLLRTPLSAVNSLGAVVACWGGEAFGHGFYQRSRQVPEVALRFSWHARFGSCLPDLGLFRRHHEEER